jgi:large subunit ribosomal protein L25
MSEHLSLNVEIRDVIGKKVKTLRQEGLLPATVYGKGFDPISIQLNERTFFQVYRKVGRTSVIDLHIPGQPKSAAFIHDVQRHPVSRSIIHADFRVVNLKEHMHSAVPITLIGESPLVEKNDAILNQSLYELDVYALPDNIPSSIELDVSVLDSLDKSIYVSDIPAHPEYEITSEADTLVVTLTQTRMQAALEEEAAAAEAEAGVTLEEEGTPELEEE